MGYLDLDAKIGRKLKALRESSKGFPLEKFFRDAWAGTVEHGVTEDQACEAIAECAGHI